MKLWRRVIKHKLRKDTHMSKNQYILKAIHTKEEREINIWYSLTWKNFYNRDFIEGIGKERG